MGAENAQARAIRGLVTAALGRDEGLAHAATELLTRSRFAAVGLQSPRAQAIALLAAAEAATSPTLRRELAPLLQAASGYAANLARLHRASAHDGWNWFEGYLSYANAELSHGLIAWGAATDDAGSLRLGLSTLDWLHSQQRGPLPQSSSAQAAFWPIGCTRVYARGEARSLWDGQPIEAAVSVAAYAAAWRADRDPLWVQRAGRALDWLLGDNLRGAGAARRAQWRLPRRPACARPQHQPGRGIHGARLGSGLRPVPAGHRRRCANTACPTWTP